MKLYHIATLAAFIGLAATPASAQCAGQNCNWTSTIGSATSAYSTSGYSTTSTNNRMAGLAPDEYLCPTTCPTSVNVPVGGRVLDCFNVCKKTPPAPVYQTYTQAYQVVRPIVYVRYPVPVMLPPRIIPAPCPIYEADSRYGSDYYGRHYGGCRR